MSTRDERLVESVETEERHGPCSFTLSTHPETPFAQRCARHPRLSTPVWNKKIRAQPPIKKDGQAGDSIASGRNTTNKTQHSRNPSHLENDLDHAPRSATVQDHSTRVWPQGQAALPEQPPDEQRYAPVIHGEAEIYVSSDNFGPHEMLALFLSPSSRRKKHKLTSFFC